MEFLANWILQVRVRDYAQLIPRVLIGATEYMVLGGDDLNCKVGHGIRKFFGIIDLKCF